MIKAKKLWTIIKSRFSTPEEDENTLHRRRICKDCPFNSVNTNTIPLKQRVVKYFSDLYSKITRREEEDNLGNCTVCGCSIYYKTAVDFEYCPKNKW